MKILKFVFRILLSVLSITALIQCLLIGFGNMDMTDMRLWVTYWKEYLMSFAIWAATYLVWRNEK